MENFTINDENNNTFPTNQYSLPFTTWIVYQIASSILILTSLYLFMMLFRYSCIQSCTKFKSHHRRLSGSRSEGGSSTGGGVERSSSITSNGSVKRSSSSRLFAKPLLALCLMGSFFALLRVGADQLELATYGGDRINCKLYQIIVVVTYALSATCLYTALWTRLRVFYGNPIMKNLYSVPVMGLVWFALFCIIASSALNTTIFLVTVTSIDSPQGCILGETISVSPTIRYVILVLSTVASQSVLLSLFLVPLIKHRSNVKKLTARSRSMSTVSQVSVGKKPFGRMTAQRSSIPRQSKKIKREKRLFGVIMRVLVTAVTCVISDVVAAVVTIDLNSFPRVLTNMVFNLNLIVNVVSVLLSFGDWKDRIAPCCHLKKSKSNVSLTITMPPAYTQQESQTRSPTTPKIPWRIGVDSPGSTGNEVTASSGNEITFYSVNEVTSSHDNCDNKKENVFYDVTLT